MPQVPPSLPNRGMRAKESGENVDTAIASAIARCQRARKRVSMGSTGLCLHNSSHRSSLPLQHIRRSRRTATGAFRKRRAAAAAPIPCCQHPQNVLGAIAPDHEECGAEHLPGTQRYSIGADSMCSAERIPCAISDAILFCRIGQQTEGFPRSHRKSRVPIQSAGETNVHGPRRSTRDSDGWTNLPGPLSSSGGRGRTDTRLNRRITC